MAAYEYSTLRKAYDNFLRPLAVITVDGNDIRESKAKLSVTNLIVDLSCGFEASQATFDIENCYDMEQAQFNFTAIKKYILLGSPVVISTGYNLTVREVFRGVICKCDFVIEDGVIPHVTVTAMDVKAVMMANHYHKQLLADKYSDAVEEIFDQSVYTELQNSEVITDISVTETSSLGGGLTDSIPGGDAVSGVAGDMVDAAKDAAVDMAKDAAKSAAQSAASAAAGAAANALTGGAAGQVMQTAQTAANAAKEAKALAQKAKQAKKAVREAKAAKAQAQRVALKSGVPGASTASGGMDSDVSIEMVGESDYEFVVRAAKKYGYEFFVCAGEVIFRKAKSDTTDLMELDNGTQIKSLNVSYDITGIVSSVEVRGLNVGKGTTVKSTKKNTNKISQGSKAKSLISGSSYVYIDPTVSAKSDADGRATYLMDDMSYRYGSLELVMHGLPEMIPGRFITISNFGSAVSNQFYVYSVQHRMLSDGSYEMKVIGKTAKMQAALPGV